MQRPREMASTKTHALALAWLLAVGARFLGATRSQPSVEVALLTLKSSALNSFIKQARKHLPLWGVVKWSRL